MRLTLLPLSRVQLTVLWAAASANVCFINVRTLWAALYCVVLRGSRSAFPFYCKLTLYPFTLNWIHALNYSSAGLRQIFFFIERNGVLSLGNSVETALTQLTWAGESIGGQTCGQVHTKIRGPKPRRRPTPSRPRRGSSRGRWSSLTHSTICTWQQCVQRLSIVSPIDILLWRVCNSQLNVGG